MSGQAEGELRPFGPTQWSLVNRACQSSLHGRREALGVLLLRYLPALRAHLKAQKRFDPERIEDLLQGFVAEKLVEQNLIARADRNRGKFRTFLLAALNHYVIDQDRQATAGKRSAGKAGPACLSDEPDVPSRESDPSAQFDIAWARELVAEALRRMNVECANSGQMEVWGIFECRVVKPAMEGAEQVPYEQLIGRFALQSPIQAFNLLTTGKRKFARILREVAGEYVGDEGMIDEEIADLKSVLSAVGA
jgi:DNA-directed RNA polymerase specialized sigma24 family protein